MSNTQKPTLEDKRRIYLPADTRTEERLDGVVHRYEDERTGRLTHYAAAFIGRRSKPEWHFRFTDEEAREKSIEQFFAGRESYATYKAEQKANRKSRALEVGDILRSTWGYEQTNVDFYQVTRLVGKTMVEIRQIGSRITEDLYMQGECWPVPDHFIGPPMRKRPSSYDGKSVSITSFSSAFKMEPDENGEYASTRWTAYH